MKRTIISVTEAARNFADCVNRAHWAALESSAKTIGFYDLIVAATALERGRAVATFNERHFAQIGGLKVIVPR